MSLKQSEHQIQSALIAWWKLQHKAYQLPEFALFAVPNGGARTAATGAILKREGVRKGIPDLLLAAPNKQYHGMFIEMKAGKNGETPEQKKFLDYVAEQGYVPCVSNSWEDAKTKIDSYLRNR